MTEPGAGWWWLSFIDPDLPEGRRFLGVAIVHADDAIAAVRRAHRLRINPGGEVAIMPVGADDIPSDDRERLLTADEAKALMQFIKERHE